MTNTVRQHLAHTNEIGPAYAEQLLPEIKKALLGLRFGSIELTVHEGKVTQIERKEKFRFQQ
ncbi:uncharacterized protein NMK_1326 [Novimethylophilus kurashikiensis]|uniref:DUF2292 domain-containing protein n=1 Tax=Novimethylophilus kurashikiensis TaxID=1825523 RepID=A0A2R5F6S7_9PROT|nr:DUF2292 domain-containing protein [Novimethylophilus kurashikiensis]GBG13775.1 uncharacterized protein NMK_1326 [Novimethylophilus kurashikiensis]